jgi:hypothetical protein
MVTRRVGLLLVVATFLVASDGKAQGFSPVINSPIITGPPVTYRGCVTTDTTACAWFSFEYRGTDALDFWSFFAPAFARGASGQVYQFLDDWGFASSDGSCVGTSLGQFFANDHCVVQARYDVTWSVRALYYDANGVPNDAFATFSVTPEPATLLLVASGAAGLGAVVRRRRRRAGA